jgi:hypothetical protein
MARFGAGLTGARISLSGHLTLLPSCRALLTRTAAAAAQEPVPGRFGRRDRSGVFHAPATAITAFKTAGVSLVTEANNHGEDCGRPGLAQSLSIAKAQHYKIVGIGGNAAQAFAPYRTVINRQRIAILGATEVLDTNLMSSWTATATQAGLASAFDEDDLVASVQEARRDNDTVVVFLHWGTETQQCPNSVQEPLARALVQGRGRHRGRQPRARSAWCGLPRQRAGRLRPGQPCLLRHVAAGDL